MKQLLTIFYLLLAGFSAVAQDNTLLWKISGNGLKTESYLFGTLHMACSADFQIAEKVKGALAKAERIAFEVDLMKKENITLIQSHLKPAPHFFDGLDARKKQAVDSALLANGIPVTIFDQVAPSVVVSLITIKGFDCADVGDMRMMEVELAKLQEAQGKPIAELESVTFQMELLDSLFSAEDLYTYFTGEVDAKAMTKDMVAAYFAEDLNKLEEIMFNAAYLSPEKQNQLLSIRNHNWLKRMPDMMADGACFFAVGAGHLLGRNGVIQLLRDEGYTLTPIKE